MQIIEQNILKTVKENEEHPFYESFLGKISDDCLSLKTGNTWTAIYSENKKQLEALGRELILSTVIQNEREYYVQEKTTEVGTRIDLLSKRLDSKTAHIIIEFKNLDSGTITPDQFKREVANAFNQIEILYILPESSPYKDNDMFTTVVCTDVNVLFEPNNSLNIERYLTTSNEQKKQQGSDAIFKDLGIYIETRQHDKNQKKILVGKSEQIWFEIPKHCILEIPKDTDDFGQKNISSRIEYAVNLPSSSSEFGVKNVRDIKDPELFKNKNLLVKDILETCFEAYDKNDKTYIAKNSKEKDFVFIQSDSIIHEQKNINSTPDRIVITTLNGAVVDGQNSLDSFRIILEILEMAINGVLKDELSPFQKQIFIKITSKFETKESLKEFKKFIEDSQVSIKITKAETANEATKFAINKNNTIPVNKSELAISKHIERIQFISHFVLKIGNYVILYPKKRNLGISKNTLKKHGVFADILANKYAILESFKQAINSTQIDYKQVLLLITNFNDVSNKNYEKAIEQFCEHFSVIVKDENTEEKRRYDEQKITLKNSKSELNRTIKDKEALLKEQENELEKTIKRNSKILTSLHAINSPEVLIIEKDLIDVQNSILNKIDQYTKEIKKLNSDLENNNLEMDILKDNYLSSSIKKYKIAHDNELINFMNSLFLVQNDPNVLKLKTNLFQKETISSFVFLMTLYTNKINFNSQSFNSNEILDTCNNLQKMLLHFESNYSSGITTIRNNKDGDIQRKDGTTETLENIRKEMFDFFKPTK